jgi:branched-chain amino acid transport system substrate-binding protein
MSDERRNDDPSDYTKYAPKRLRDAAPSSSAERPTERQYLPSAPTIPAPAREHQDRRTPSDFASWSEPVRPPRSSQRLETETPPSIGRSEPVRPPPPAQPAENGTSTLIGRIAFVATFTAVAASALIFSKPISQYVHALFDTDSRPVQASKSDLVARNNVASNNPVLPGTQVAAASIPASVAMPVAQPAAATVGQPAWDTVGQSSTSGPMQQQAAVGPEPRAVKNFVRGVTDSEIRFGISAAFSGPAKELGQNMRLGIEAAFKAANANGGVHGRQLRLIATDDGYEPSRTAVTMKQLYEKDQVFGIVGNVGTPTATVGLPYALERKMLFFGAFTGAGLLRNDPPDRYVFNYRASYAEETAAMVHYLVKVKRLRTDQIAVFAQQDSYGDSGFTGVAKAVRSLGGKDNAILRLNYERNTVDVDDAVEQLRKSRIPIKAVIMVPTYRAAAKFIEKTRDSQPDLIYASVSFVGSTALANELMLLGKRFAKGVIVTQVVPALEGHSSLVLDYKSALAKHLPGEPADYVSLEGYVAANVLIEGLKRSGSELDTEKLVDTLENLRDLDIGLGTPVSFSRSEHQGVHKVWGTQLDENGRYQPFDMQ